MSLFDTEVSEGPQWLRVGDVYEVTKKPRGLSTASLSSVPFAPMDAIPQGGDYAPDYIMIPIRIDDTMFCPTSSVDSRFRGNDGR